MKRSPYKKLVVGALIAAFVIAASFGLTTGVAHAANNAVNFQSCTSNLFTCAVYGVSLVINGVLGVLVSLGAVVIGFGLNLDGNVFNSPTVQTGFSIALSVANLGFVLGIIVIAIATILRSETYGIKQMLWKLIAMAILVNFGLVITAPIVGFADNLSNYFVNADGGYGNFVLNLTNAFAPQNLTQPPPVANGGVGQIACNAVGLTAGPIGQLLCNNAVQFISGDTSGASSFTSQVFSLIFSAIFTAITAITFFAIGILLIIRYLYLAFLLVLLPLAWLTWILPKFSHHFTRWWSEFFKWTFFPVISLFFIYIALLSVSNVNGQIAVPAASLAGSNPQGPLAGLTTSIGGNVGIIQTALDELLLAGLCLGGLFAANALSIKGADTAVGAAKWVGDQAKGYVGRKASNARRNVTDRARSAGRQYDPATRETTTALQRFGSRLQGVPGLKGAGAALANQSAPTAFHHEREEDIKKYTDANLKSLTNDGIVKRATAATAFINPTQAAAIAQELARRNLTTDPKIKPLMDKYVEVAHQMGTLEAITNNRPDLMPPREKAPGVMESQQEATARAIKSAKGDIVQANPEIFHATDPTAAAAKLGPHITPAILETAVLTLVPAQLGPLGSDTSAGSQERQANITDAIKDLINKLGLKKEITQDKEEVDPVTKMKTGKMITVGTGKYELNTAALATAIASRPELKNLQNIVKHMESSSNWGSVLN